VIGRQTALLLECRARRGSRRVRSTRDICDVGGVEVIRFKGGEDCPCEVDWPVSWPPHRSRDARGLPRAPVCGRREGS
jgi:hypothetical protein